MCVCVHAHPLGHCNKKGGKCKSWQENRKSIYSSASKFKKIKEKTLANQCKQK